MSARDIDTRHRSAFQALLTELEAFVPVERDGLVKLFEMTKYPKGQTVVQLATSLAFSDRCFPYEPTAALTGPPNHISKAVGLYEFKLRHVTRSGGPNDQQVFPVSLSLLPSGRRVLKIFGLTLDSKGEWSTFERSTLTADKVHFQHLPAVVAIVRGLIEGFPIEASDKKSKDCRDWALAELTGN